MQALVLASGSQYRAQLLQRLNLEFQAVSPDVDESSAHQENPAVLACRLAHQKAFAPAVLACANALGPPAIVIASDQVASVDHSLLGKPGSHDRACEQLQAMSGRSVTFHTALHMISLPSGDVFTWLDATVARLRVLTDEEIQRYVTADCPLDCAGSFKVETLGISLFDSIQSDDPTALIGLPMIAVCRGLRKLGMTVP